MRDRGQIVCVCGRANPADGNFCLGCGAPLGRRCTACDAELPSDANFCGKCGAPAGDTPSPAPLQPARREVRKVVTVVFVDLAGSTSLQEHMDPESVRRVMDRFYATMRGEIEAEGGLVVKFTGDGVMAGFGIREAREDDALRAVRAAAAMRDSFDVFAEGFAERHGATVSLRIGVNTGEVVVSEDDDDVVGDVVNVAARLEHAAGEGDVLVGGETYRLTRHIVTYEITEPLELKGKAEPVPAYRVVSLEAPDDEETAAPFVGRADELARIHEVFDRTAAERSPTILTVVGSPGLGKTRLAAEFAATVVEHARILEARCYATTTATYAPLAEALREASGIPETATSEDVVAALRGLLPEGFAEAERVATLVASLLGVGQAVAPQETFWAVRRLLEGSAADRPLVLVVDDVQWAEPLLLDLFDHVIEWAKDAPVMIVALARPEIREVRPSLLDAGAIVLEGLPPEDTAELAAGLVGGHDLPADLVGRILAATEGNPLFVRELLRMLVDDGVLSREGDRWTVTVEAEAIDVPPTIQALLSARIERLNEEERAVVERASVVGKEFYRGAVLELCPPQVGTGLDGHLETLRRKELVEPEGTYWIDERVFRFHHVLIRDAAYRRLLKEARAELHERFADWLEAKVGDLVGEHEEVVGYHLEQAHDYLKDLGPLDDHGIDLGRRASAHLASATRRALDRDDLAAAANLSGRALALTGDEDARSRILLDRCEALLGMGDVGATADAVGELRTRASDDRLRAWADCFDGQLTILTDPSRLHETVDVVENAARRLADLGDSAGAAKAYAVHAQALAHLGQFGTCEAVLDRALAAAREAGDRRRANAVLSRAPFAALWGPSPVPRASGRCLDVVRVLRITAGAPAVEATALRCQSVLEAMRGRSGAAHRMLASARNTLEELGLRHALVECDLFAGLIDLLSQDATGAEVHLRRAYEGFCALNVGTDVAQAAALLARALLELGREDEALELSEESERLGGDDLKTVIAWRCVRARVLARRGESGAALALAREAVGIAEATDALVDHADARLALAEVLAAAGMQDESEAEARIGHELYDRKEAAPVSAQPPAARHEGAKPAGSTPGDGGVHVHTAPGISADQVVAILDRYLRALLDGDWHAMAQVYEEDLVVVDHRSGLRSRVIGRRDWVDAMRTMWQDVESGWDFEVLAAWGREIALTRVCSSGQGWERAYLMLTVDRGGVVSRTEIFDPDDHPSALARLDELSYELSTTRPAVERHALEQRWTDVVGIAAGGDAALVRADGSLTVVRAEGGAVSEVEPFGDDELGARKRLHQLAPSPSYVSWFVRHHFDRHAHQDWDAIRALNAPNVLVVDRRPVGWGTLSGVDPVLEHLQEGARTASVAPGELRITEWQAIAPDGALCRYRWSGTSPDGVDFDFERLLLMRIRAADGLLVRSYMYDPDQTDEARRLMAGDDISHRAAPGVVADLSVYDRARTAMLDRDREAMVGLHTPDHVFLDHRAGLQSEVSGPDEFLEGSARAYQGLESGRSIEILSQWTDDLSLSRVTSWGDGFEISSLFVRVARDGAWCRTEQFDAEDYETAFARLDELAYEQSAAKPAIDRYVSAPNEHGWTEVVPVVASGTALVVRAGGSFAVIDTADGRVTEVEVFDLDDELGARRRLHALGRSPSYVSWLVRYHHERHAHQDWEALRSLIAPDVVIVDHGPVAFGALHGIEQLLAWFQQGATEGMWIAEWLAITENRALYRYRWFGTSPEDAAFEVDRLMVTEIRDGVTVRGDIFDADQIDEAQALMAGEDSGAAQPAGGARAAPTAGSIDVGKEDFDALRRESSVHPIVAAVQRIVELGNAGDWTGVADAIAEDVVYQDHRALMRTASRGREVVLQAVRYQLGDGGRLDLEVVEDRGPNLALVRVVKRLGASGESEIPLLIIYGLDGDGRLSHALLFEEKDVGKARSRLDAITPMAVPSVHGPPTAFVEFGRRWQEAFAAGAGEALAALYAPEFEVVEYTNHITLDLETHLDEMQRVASQPNGTARVECIVGLGTRHGVNRTFFSWDQADGAGGHSEFVGVSAVRLDPEGRCPRFEWFPADQMHRALARAEELYLEDEATGEAAVGARRRLAAWRLLDAHNDGDWETYGQGLAPDIVFVDRRQLGWGVTEGREAVVDLQRAILARSVSHVWSVTAVHAIGDHGVVYAHGAEGVDRDGGRYEQGGVVVALLTDDGASRVEIFGFDAVDEAVARFDELRSKGRMWAIPSSASEGVPSNTYTAVWARWLQAAIRRDWDEAATYFAPGVALVDDRAGLQQSLPGLDQVMRNQREAANLDYALGHDEVVATRGDRLGLHRVVWTAQVDPEIEMLILGELDDQERIRRQVVFDQGDLDAAVAELDARYAATLSFAEAEVLDRLTRVASAYNARDWNAYAGVFSDDVLVVDHRPAGWGTVRGVGELLPLIRGLVELVGDASVLSASIERISATGALGLVRTSGTDRNGAGVEFLYYSVFSFRYGMIVRDERFPIDAGDAALACFDELVEESRRRGST